MNRSTMWWPVAAMTCLTAAAAPALAQTVDLRPRFEKGAESRFEMVVDGATELSSAMMGAQKQEIKQVIGLKLVPGETDAEGNTKVQLVYESIKLNVTSPMMTMEFDSAQDKEKDAGNMLAESLRPLIGAELTMTVDKTGSITNVEGSEAGSNPITAGLTSVDGLKAGLGPVFTTRNDDGKAEVGETWTFTDKLPSSPLGELTIVSEHTLKELSGTDANIDVKGKLTLDSASAQMPMTLEEGSYKGQYVWDTAKGMLKSFVIDQSTKMSGDMGGGQATAVNTSKTTITRR